MCWAEQNNKFLFPWTGESALALQILVISDDMHGCSNIVIDYSTIKISTSVARLLKPFVVDHFSEIARGNFGKLRLGEILQMAKTQIRIKWRNEEP
jgi:hypothetical protein